MKILSTKQIRALDDFTIENEPIPSIDLMERASRAFTNWFTENFRTTDNKVQIFCGMGNNGGDGLAVARMLQPQGYEVEVFVLRYADKSSPDFEINFARLKKQLTIQEITAENFGNNFPINNAVIIDAILGSGLSRPLDELTKNVVQQINATNSVVVAVDIATGLYADTENNADDIIIKPDFTISFQLPKLAFCIPQNADFVGNVEIIKIGLNQDFIEKADSSFYYTDSVKNLIKQRAKYAHKGTFGHALLVVGSYGMMGAAILSARACMRSGVGKLSAKVPKCGYEIMQNAIPEALVLTDENEKIQTQNIDYQAFSAIGIGCGIGKDTLTVKMVKDFLKNCKTPLVIDADALTIIAENNFESLLPKNSILTPHPKEFEKLIKKSWKNDFEKLDFLKDFSNKYSVIICLKGANTAIALPNGEVHFNSTGNAGMAKAGTGDVLTGIITALLAQGYSATEAAILGVYEHGFAGDIVAQQRGMVAMLASDIIEELKF